MHNLIRMTTAMVLLLLKRLFSKPVPSLSEIALDGFDGERELVTECRHLLEYEIEYVVRVQEGLPLGNSFSSTLHSLDDIIELVRTKPCCARAYRVVCRNVLRDCGPKPHHDSIHTNVIPTLEQSVQLN